MLIPVLFVLALAAAAAEDELRLVQRPSNVSVPLGQDVLLKCAAEKSELLYAQWKTNTDSLLGFHNAGPLSVRGGRYSYVKESPEELHLRIERVSLEDDGMFECQMIRPSMDHVRASAFVNVVVPPTRVYFANYVAGSDVEVQEDATLNITCVAPHAKPQADIAWYINGRQITENIQHWNTYNLNKTVTSQSALLWKTRRGDHKKVITCEASHGDSVGKLRANLTLSVLYPSDRPQVSIASGDSYVKAGENVTLVCVAAGGNPPPALTWHLNNKLIDQQYRYDVSAQETRNTYSFIAEASDNMAAYECRSQNLAGNAPLKKTVQVKVAFAPQGVDILGEATLKQGATTTVQCRSRAANPPAKISWLVNGHPVPSNQQSEHQQAHGTISISNLTIHSNEVMSAGHRVNVECNARNDEGASSKQHLIKILAPPLTPKISGLEEVYAEGDVVNVTCEAVGGNPLAEIVWFRGHEKMSGARSSVSGNAAMSTLTLSLDRSMNNQKLRCEASNAALDEPLVDMKPLNVVFGPQRVTIRTPEGSRHQMVAGRESRLLCSSPASNPPAVIHWEFSPAGSDGPVVYAGETTLNESSRETGWTVENVVSFTPLETFDGTVVRCVATHPLWRAAVNTTFPLNVHYAPRLLVDSPVSIVATEGDSFHENLTVRANPPVSDWRWRKNGIPFQQQVGNVFARYATLSGRQLKDSDAGQYTLFATNNVGTANVTININIEFPARITRVSSPITASAGEAVVLECEAEGVPSKENMVKWTRNGKEIPFVHSAPNRVALRLNASTETAGQYMCVADNGIGVPAESPAFLLVKRPPSVVQLPSLARAAGALGGRARVRCRVEAVPDAQFDWLKAGQPIRANNTKYAVYSTQLNFDTHESTLYVSDISPDDYQTEYRCVARNQLGRDEVVIPVGPLSPPDTPLQLVHTNTTPNTISISWLAGFDGGAEQTFEVRYQLDGDSTVHSVNTSNNHVRLSGLQPARAYLFQVRALNGRGFSSDFSRPATVVSTLTEDGVDVSSIIKKKDTIPRPIMIFFAIGGTLLLLFNCLLLCYLQKRQRRKKIQEKTEMLRSTLTGDSAVRPVQMYGATGSHGAMTRIEDEPRDVSEDDHSVRTMIEVNPNGYMQQIDPAFYERNCLVEYEYDPHGYSSQAGTMSRHQGTYSNMPYPEPPREQSVYSDRSLSRRPYNPQDSPHLSTFIQQNSVRAGPIHYSQLDGDLV